MQSLPVLFWIAWLVVVLVVSAEWCMTFWGASFLQSKLHLDAGSAATLLALYLLSTIAGRFIGSRLTRVVTGPLLLLLALGVTLLGFSFFWLAPVALLTTGGLLVTGLGVSNLWPQAIACAFATAPQQPDRASAKVSLGAGLAISLAPLLLGTLANTTGLKVAYGIVPCLLITALVMNGFAVIWSRAQGVARYVR
jgi:fucose permease